MADDRNRRELMKLVKLIQHRSERVVRGVAVTLFNEIQTGGEHSPGTPIDKGYHRGAWSAALNASASGAYSEGAKPEVAEAQVLETVARMTSGDTIEMVNNGPAIRRLEFDAWSSQAPNGFVRPAAEAFEQIVDEVAAHIASEG